MAELSQYMSMAIQHKMRVYYTGLTGLTGFTTDTPGVANTNFSNQHCAIFGNPAEPGKANILINVNASDLQILDANEHVTMLFGAFGQAVAQQIFSTTEGVAAAISDIQDEDKGLFAGILDLLDQGYAQSHVDEAIGGPLLSAEQQYVDYIFDKGAELSDYVEDINQFFEALRQFGLRGYINSDFSNPGLQQFFVDNAKLINDAMFLQNEAERIQTAKTLTESLSKDFGIHQGLTAADGRGGVPGPEKKASDKSKGVTVTNRQAVLDALEEFKRQVDEGEINPDELKVEDGAGGSQLISHDKEVNEKMKELGMSTDIAPDNAEQSGVTIMEDDRHDDEMDQMMSDLDQEVMSEGIADSELDDISPEASGSGGSGLEIEYDNESKDNTNADKTEGAPDASAQSSASSSSLPAVEQGQNAGNISTGKNEDEFEYGAASDHNQDRGDTDQEVQDHDFSSSGTGRDEGLAKANGEGATHTGAYKAPPSFSGLIDEKAASVEIPEDMKDLTDELFDEISSDAAVEAEEAAKNAQALKGLKENFDGIGCIDLHGLCDSYSDWLTGGKDEFKNKIVAQSITDRGGVHLSLTDNPYETTFIKSDPESLGNTYSDTVNRLKPQIDYLSDTLTKMLIKERNAHSYGKKGKLDIKKQINKPNSLRPFVKHNNTENEFNTCVTCVVDLSGSMEGPKAYQAMLGSIILSETCAKLHIPCKIVGFHSPRSRTESPDHEHFTSWSNTLPERQSLLAIPSLADGNNYDAFAITTIAEDALKTAPADHNLVFVLSDGYPQTRDYSHDPEGQIRDSEYEVRRIVRALKRKARVYGIGIEHDVSNIYENTTINITDAKQIGTTIGSYLKVALRDFIREDL